MIRFALAFFCACVLWAAIYTSVGAYQARQQELFLQREEQSDCQTLKSSMYSLGLDCHGHPLPDWGTKHGVVDQNSRAWHVAHPTYND